jgi:excisionase family DNA binding protein
MRVVVDDVKREPLLTVEQAAERLNISRDTFDAHVAPNIPRVRIGRVYRFDPRDLDDWIEANKVRPGRAARATSASEPVAADPRRPTLASEAHYEAHRRSMSPRVRSARAAEEPQNFTPRGAAHDRGRFSLRSM